MITYQKEFPEKENEAKNEKIVYLINYLGRFELVKYHYFAKSRIVGLVNILVKADMKQVKNYIKIYDYTLGSKEELPTFWEITL